MKLEQEAWSEVGNIYKSMLSEVDKREKGLLSGTGKGKERATLEDIARWEVDERDIPAHFRGPKGISLATGIIGGDSGRKSPLSKRVEDLELTVSCPKSCSRS